MMAPPSPAESPILTCRSPIRAVSDAMTMSQKSATVAPSPTASPFRRQITGFSRSSRPKTICFASTAIPSKIAGSSIASCSQSMSPPAQKARPAPVSTTMSVSSSAAISRKSRAISLCMAAFTALSTSGRFSVTVSTRRARANVIVVYRS